jgi:2-iminobutanoate/2-iminopropanoate deaminase
MKTISTPDAPQPAGHYSQAVVCGGVVYVSGQLPHDATDPNAPPGDASAQTRRALANVDAILKAAGSGLGHVLQMTIYVTDIGLWSEINETYADVMGEHRPARAVVPIGPLRDGSLLEVQATAALP